MSFFTDMANVDAGQILVNLTAQMTELSRAFREQSIVQSIKPFSGESIKYKDWIKSVNKAALLAELPDQRKRYLAFQTSSGAVADFCHRYLTDHPHATWEQFERELGNRFGEVEDPHCAFANLRKIRQRNGESVNVYCERLLEVAREAYQGQAGGLDNAQRQLIGFFIDGLLYDALKIKVMRDNPNTLAGALTSAQNEQNIRKRIAMRSGLRQGRPDLREGGTNNTRTEEPMEVDHSRVKGKCGKCQKWGHYAKDCRNKQVSVIGQEGSKNIGH